MARVAGGGWSVRSVFVSSTFQDMHAERDYLRDVVLPELAEWLRARRCHLELVDLRWGVEAGDAGAEGERERQVLKVCLDEIDRCRPYIVVLLGDRYGWVPPEGALARAAGEKGLEAGLAGRSVTALEIEYGILRNPEQAERCLVYLREPLPYEEMPPEVAETYREPVAGERWRRLQELKRRLEEELGGGRVRRYRVGWDAARQTVTGLEAWGRMVLEDLRARLEGDSGGPGGGMSSWQEEERAALEEFFEERTRTFVGREEELAELRGLALGAGGESAWAAVVTGGPGTGKSALLARLAQALEGEGCLVLAHAAGISARAGSVEAMLRRWCSELAGELRVADPAEGVQALAELEKEFALLLSQAAVGRRVVVLVDGLNQFDASPAARYVTWLPELWPVNARLIVTAVPGEESGAVLKRRGARELALAPLSEGEIAGVVRAVAARYHKAVPAEVIEALKRHRREDGGLSAANPLWLTVAMNELLLLDEEDFRRQEGGDPEGALRRLLVEVAEGLPASVPGVYRHLLGRAERRFGGSYVRAVVDAVAVSRRGLREGDLARLVPELGGGEWSELRFAMLRRYLRPHLVRRGALGLWGFAHAQMRESVAVAPERARQVEGAIVGHLEELPAGDPLRASELMHHYRQAGEPLRAAQYLAASLTVEERAGAVTVLAEGIVAGGGCEGNAGLEWALLLTRQEVGEEGLFRICNHFLFDLLDALAARGVAAGVRRVLAAELWRRLEELHCRAPESLDFARGLAVSHGRLGDLCREQRDLEGARQHYEKALEVAEELHRRAPESLDFARDLWVSHNKLGDLCWEQRDLEGARQHYEKALEVAEELHRRAPESLDFARDLAVSHGRLGDLCREERDLEGARQHYENALALREELHRRAPESLDFARDLAVSHGRLGDLCREERDLEGARQHYEKALEVAEELHRRAPESLDFARDLAVSHGGLGDLCWEQRDLEGARQHYEKALEVAEELHRRAPESLDFARDLSVSHNKLGDLCREQRDLEGARQHYEKALALREELHRRAPESLEFASDLAVSHRRLGDLCLEQRDLEGARQHYEKALEIAEELHRRAPESLDFARDLSILYERLGDLCRAEGDLEGARQHYGKELEIAAELHRRAPESLEFARDLALAHMRLGDLCREERDLEGARQHYEKALEIAEELHRRAPESLELARDLSVSYERLGDLCLEQRDLEGARQHYEKALALREELHRRAPQSVEFARDLALAHMRLGDLCREERDLEGARQHYEKALALREELRRRTPASLEFARGLVAACQRLALCSAQQGKDDEAGRWLVRCLELLREMEAQGMRLDAQLQEFRRRLEGMG